MNASLARYIASIAPTPAMLAERAYIAERAPKLSGLYLRDRRALGAALECVADAIRCDPPRPADMPLLDALLNGADDELGCEIHRAIDWHMALQADLDATDEAAWVREEGGL